MSETRDKTDRFRFEKEPMALPGGASAKSSRHVLCHKGQAILALSQGRYRPYVFPLYTPGGFAVTSESPADHPHHNSVWFGSDHVHAHVPAANGQTERYGYNFYVNEVFQGRAAGKIEGTGTKGEARGSQRFEITQTLHWRGPPEWGAPDGRVVLHERRKFCVQPGEGHHIIDIESRLHAPHWDITLGPTRHGLFNVRVAPAMAAGGALRDADARTDPRSICNANPGWVDFEGPVGGGHRAGITVMAHPECGLPNWFVSQWGVLTVGHFRDQPHPIAVGEHTVFKFRLVVRDVGSEGSDPAGLFLDYVKGGHE
ncbi:MAG: hypothetical protein GXP01_08675 [Alphaproteobacteria bacterium]|nr:hypothetical protein [Alphaproteobacteria bacterium]